MKDKYKIALDVYELRIMIKALNDLRTKQLDEQKPTDPVDELILKLVKKLEK